MLYNDTCWHSHARPNSPLDDPLWLLITVNYLVLAPKQIIGALSWDVDPLRYTSKIEGILRYWAAVLKYANLKTMAPRELGNYYLEEPIKFFVDGISFWVQKPNKEGAAVCAAMQDMKYNTYALKYLGSFINSAPSWRSGQRKVAQEEQKKTKNSNAVLLTLNRSIGECKNGQIESVGRTVAGRAA
jgi:hypothetical protein